MSSLFGYALMKVCWYVEELPSTFTEGNHIPTALGLCRLHSREAYSVCE